MKTTDGNNIVKIREELVRGSEARVEDRSQRPQQKRAPYQPPRIESLGDLRSSVLGGSGGAGDSLPPNTKPI